MMRKRTSFFIKIPEIKVILSEAFFLVYAYFQAHCSHHEGHEEHEETFNHSQLHFFIEACLKACLNN